MPRARYNLEVKILEQAIRNPKNAEEAALTPVKLEQADTIVSGNSIDECRRKVRELAEVKLRRVIRGLSIQPSADGKTPVAVRAVVFNADEVKARTNARLSRLNRGR